MKGTMAKTIISEQWDLIPLEKQKLLKSFWYAVLALFCMVLADYLKKFGLPSQFQAIAPFVPFIVNFLNKWAGEHTYTQ